MTPRIAVVGAGPAGFYASQHILKHLPESRIDIYEALPVPYGLVRYKYKVKCLLFCFFSQQMAMLKFKATKTFWLFDT